MDKKICWGIKMAMTNTGEEAFDVSLEAVRYYSGIMMAGLSEIGVSDGEARTEKRLYQIWESWRVHALHRYP